MVPSLQRGNNPERKLSRNQSMLEKSHVLGRRRRQLTRRRDSDVDLARLQSDKVGQGLDGKTGWRHVFSADWPC